MPARLLEVTLYQDPHSPFSERARRALGEKGIYQRRVNVAWSARDELERRFATRETPVLACGGRVMTTSGAIARWADRAVPGGMTLFPDAARPDVAAWERRANDLARQTLPLAVPVWADVMTDAAERRAFLAAHAGLGSYGALKAARMDHWRRVMREWRLLDEALADRDYLLGSLTYADHAVYGSVYLAAQFHAFEVPQALERLAAWYETIRTAGIMRDQELLLAKARRGDAHHDIDYTRATTRYGDPMHRPDDAKNQDY